MSPDWITRSVATYNLLKEDMARSAARSCRFTAPRPFRCGWSRSLKNWSTAH